MELVGVRDEDADDTVGERQICLLLVEESDDDHTQKDAEPG